MIKKKKKIAKQEQNNEIDPVQEIISFVKTLVGAIIVVMIVNGLFIASFVVPTGSMERTVMTGDFLFVNKFIYGPTTPQVLPFVNVPLPFYKFPALKKPKNNDVIVFIYPGDRDDLEPKEFTYYLKRCVGISGDKIQIKNKVLYVNDKESPLPEHGVLIPERVDYPAGFPLGAGFTTNNYGPITIPKKGDEIQLNLDNIHQWITFIKREGHDVTFDANNVFIDGKITNSYKVKRNYYFAMGDNRDNSEDSRAWGFVPEENIIGSPLVVYWSWDTDLPISNFLDKLSTVRWDRIGNLIH